MFLRTALITITFSTLIPFYTHLDKIENYFQVEKINVECRSIKYSGTGFCRFRSMLKFTAIRSGQLMYLV